MKFVKSHKKTVAIVSAVLLLSTIIKTYVLWNTLGSVLQIISIAFGVFFLVFAILPWFLKETPKED